MKTEDLVIYRAPDGDISVNVLVENETVCLRVPYGLQPRSKIALK